MLVEQCATVLTVELRRCADQRLLLHATAQSGFQDMCLRPNWATLQIVVRILVTHLQGAVAVL